MKKTVVELMLFASMWIFALYSICVLYYESQAGPITNALEIQTVLDDIADDLNREEEKPQFGAEKTPEGTRPGPNSYETDWTKWLAAGKESLDFQGKEEFKTVDGSWIDIYTDSGYTIEVEWASKWKEAIGQALYYSILEDAKPGIILLFKGDAIEKIYYMRLMIVASKYGIKVWVVETKKR